MLFNPFQTFLHITLCIVISVSAQGIPYQPRPISNDKIDTLKNGSTVEYSPSDSSGFVKTDPNKPRKKLSHPVALGLAAIPVGFLLTIIGAPMTSEYHNEFQKGWVKNPNYNPVVGTPLTITGLVLVIVGPLYAMVGGIYNATLPAEEAPKKSSAEHIGFTPGLSISQSGKLQPGMMAWMNF